MTAPAPVADATDAGPVPVRVRCGGKMHTVTLHGSRLRFPGHIRGLVSAEVKGRGLLPSSVVCGCAEVALRWCDVVRGHKSLGAARLPESWWGEARAAHARHAAHNGSRYATLCAQTPVVGLERLRHVVRERVIQSVHDVLGRADYREAGGRWAGGSTSVEVHIGEVPTARGESERRWSRNGKWSGLDATLSFRVKLDWRRTVEARGLAVVGGVLVLDVDGDAPDTRRGWRVLAVQQGRGFALHARYGWAQGDRVRFDK